MSRCECIHETIVKDIFDILNDAKDFDEVEWLNKRNNTGSIAKRANNLILVFPVIVSSTISIDTAIIISKAIERKCVSLMQILFSSMQYSTMNNLGDYIKQFHTNMNVSNGMTLDDLIRFNDYLIDVKEATVTDADAYQMVKEDMKNLNYYINNIYKEASINDYKVYKNPNTGNIEIISEAKHRGSRTNKTTINSSTEFKYDHAAKKDTTEYFSKQIIQADYDKANELLPTMMMVNFVQVKGNVKIVNTGVVGIKAHLYPVDAMDIINRVSSKYSDSNSFFNLIRASTREISFFKDFAFAIDKARFDAIQMANESNNAKIFKLLERRASRNKLYTLLKRNDASPITSLVIAAEDVEYIKKYHNIDLHKESTCRTILNSYNLMDIIIADESLEYAKFLYDDDSSFETIPFSALEKSSKDGGTYKKIINLMAKMNR
jgi:hypothetical protein